jgi:hypothetical protein
MRARKPWLIAAGCALALVIGAGVVWLRAGDPEPGSAPPAVAASALSVAGRGATVPFIEHEAEAAAYTGTLIGPTREAKTLAGEASGRQAVTLERAGDQVEFTLTAPANALTVRLSIPDSADGRGADATLTVAVDGAPELELATTSRYGWLYGGFPFTDNPADGSAHHFYDHSRALFDRELPAGTKVALRKGDRDGAASYTIDLADFELVAPAGRQPAGSVSVLDHGADPAGERDATSAIAAAIAAAKVAKAEVWLPAGRFKVTEHLIVDDVTVRGAGMWHTALAGDGVGVYGKYAPDPSRNVKLYDFAILGEVTERDDHAQVNGVGGALGGGSVVQGLLIAHTKCGFWLDGPFDGLTVRGNRILDQQADGLNLHRGVSNVIVEQNFVRNTGDDGLASWADEFPNHDNVFRFNTVLLPMLANGISIYGGHDNTVSDNVIADTLIEGGGIHLANRFSGTVFLSGMTTVARNTVLRAGGRFDVIASPVGAVWIYGKDAPISGGIRLVDNELIDSSYVGLQFFANRIADVEVDGLLVDGAGTFGIGLQTTGSGVFDRITLLRSGKAGMFSCPDALLFAVSGSGGAGMDSTYCGPYPEPVYSFSGSLPTHGADAMR